MLRFVFALSALLLCYASAPLKAQELRNPFDFPILFSGNFGELRNNHFHAGLDFKTQGAVGKPVHAVAAGYVSRLTVGPYGYGNALYITHPDGTTTVYGHLLRFAEEIERYVREQQYEEESFSVDLSPDSTQFPVRKGDVVALSGNTGSSAGPHLHFEVRDTKTQELIDPLSFFEGQMTDTRPPQIQGIAIYPMEGRGVVNGKAKMLELKPVASKDGKHVLTGKIQAWGDIGLAVKAYDRMNNTSNIYGVRKIVLRLDSAIVFRSTIDRFAPEESRYLNSFTDYAEWKERRSFYMKSFVEPGNRLRFLESVNRGVITINEEKTYHLAYRLEDALGNFTTINIWVEGKEQPIPAPDTTGTAYFHWRSENKFGAKGVRLAIPPGNLYDDLYFRYSLRPDSTAAADTHILHDRPVALHRNAQLSLRLNADTLPNKEQYGIVRRQGGHTAWVGGTYRNGWIDADIRELGAYTVARDTKAPAITPVNPAAWGGSQKITIRVADNLSGVKSFRGEIDGEYALFELDGKTGLATYRFDKERLKRGTHKLVFTLVDNCRNMATYEHTFVW